MGARGRGAGRPGGARRGRLGNRVAPGRAAGPPPDEEAPEETQARLAEQLPPVVAAPVADGSWTVAPAAPCRRAAAGRPPGPAGSWWSGAAPPTTARGRRPSSPTAPRWTPSRGPGAPWRRAAVPAAGARGRVDRHRPAGLGRRGPDGLLADGAAWNPATDRWRALPPAPLAPRADAAARLDRDGAAGRRGPGPTRRSLTQRRWTRRPAAGAGGAPCPPRSCAPDPAALALPPRAAGGPGGEGVVVWRAGRGGGGAAAAAWDPATGAWALLPVPAEATTGSRSWSPGAARRLHGLRTTADGTEAVAVTLARRVRAPGPRVRRARRSRTRGRRRGRPSATGWWWSP